MAAYCFSLAWWSGWECAALQMSSRELSFLLMRIEYMGVAFISTLFCTTVTYLLDFSSQARRKLLLPLYSFSIIALFFISLFPTRYFFGVSPGSVAYLPIWGWAGPYYWIFLAIWLGIGVLGHAMIFLRWRRAEGQERIRLALFLWGTLFAYIGGCPEFALKYGIRLGWLNPFGLYGFPFYVGLLTYAIVRHHFLAIQIVIRRSIFYALFLAFLVAGYVGLVYATQQLFRMDLLQHHVLALALTAATTFGLGLLVFFAEPKRRLNQIFGLYSLSISWWAFWESLSVGARSLTEANVLFKFDWLGVVFIAPAFVHTVFLLTNEKGRAARFILRISYSTSFLFAILLLFSDLILTLPRPVGYARFFNGLTPLGLLIPAVFFILVNIGLWKLGCAYKAAIGQRKTQLKYLFWASLAGYLGGSLDWLLPFGLSIPPLNPFGIYTVPLYSIATTYAVLHHRLFDFNLVIRKSLIYSMLVTMLTVGYFGLVYGIEQTFRTTLGYQSFWISLAAFALTALLFQPLKIGIQRLVDWLLFRAPHEELVRRMERLEQGAREAEKMKAVAILAAGLCHELRNPLQAIQTHAEFLPECYDDPGFRKRCSEVMQTEIARINNLLKQLMDFAKPKPPVLKPVEPHRILESTLDFLNSEFAKRQVQLEKRYEANGAQVQVDPDQLRQLILNLVLNALQAIGQKGQVMVSTFQENGWFTLEVTDTGPGIDPAILPRLFEPFNSNKPGGVGLGLSIVHSIVREHRGQISVQSRLGQGVAFAVKFPL